MHDKYRVLGETIQDRREQVGLTQDELSDRAGLSYSTLSKIERGVVKNPSVFTISSIATALGCSIDEILKAGKPQSLNSNKGPSDTFVFSDLNGVMVRFFQKAFVEIAHQCAITPEKVETAFWHYNDAANRGEMSPEKFNRVMAEHLGIATFDWHGSYLNNVEPIPAMQDCLVDVAKTNRVGILSNIHHGLIDKMLEKGLIPDIDYACIVDSSEVGAIKPEQRIYEIAQEMAGTMGEDVFFIDDSRTNLIAAQRLGWRVMWFDDYRPEDSVTRLKQALEL